MLIVCEGTQTEPEYFADIRDYYRLSTANVKIVRTGGDPRALVREAKTGQEREEQQGERYDRIYCVFDRDEHPNFAAASAEAKSSGFRTVRSWPCFEFWFLLHFRYTRRPYRRTDYGSPCENCIRDLRKYMPGYEKARKGRFQELEDRLDSAGKHARRALDDARKTGDPNPSTEVHKLVEYLQTLKDLSGSAAT